MPKIINTKENKITLPLKRKIVPEDIEINFEGSSGGGTVVEGMNTVNFMVDGVVYATQSVEEGKTIKRPDDPTKEGYTFYGWSGDGSDKISFPYTPSASSIELTAVFTEGQNASVSGLGNSSYTNQVYTKTDNFPTSFEEVTDDLGNVFIKIPTMYRKVDTVTDNQITKFTLSTTKIDDTYEPYSVFVKPNGEVMPYVLIGKYINNSSTSMVSVETTARADVTIGNARNWAREIGTGYQIYDWQFQKLFVDLALLVSQKVNFQDGSVAISEYLGIKNINIGCWVDGVSRASSTWCIAYDPTKYVDSATSSTTGYTAVSYTAPTSSSVNITKLGYDENNPFFNYPNAAASNSSYNTYYCDGYWYSSGNHPVYSTVGDAYADNGLWRCNTSIVWSNAYGARLCYRPL